MTEFELVYSPLDMEEILKQPVSWDAKADRPIPLARYIATRLPQVAASLGLESLSIEEPSRDVDELTDEEQRQVTLAILEAGGPKHWAIAVGRSTYTYEEVVDGVRNNRGFGTEKIRMTMQERRFFLSLVEAGSLRLDPNRPDIGNLPR